MNENLSLCERDYERVVAYFINHYKFKANLISEQDFLVGCSLFNLGNNIGYEQSVKILEEFLQSANVQTKSEQELENISAIKKQLKDEVEERKSGR